ncbi:MAG: hypothetical protein Q9219_003785 [cf. Caloplaca sp. 3 TL-2023]
MADELRFLPRTLFFVERDGTENPPKAAADWQYPPEAYIFLSFDDRCYPVPRSKIKDLAALTASPNFKDKHWLQLPQGTTEGQFRSFYFFLAYGVHPPSFSGLDENSTFSTSAKEGPPKIKPYDANAPGPVLSLVASFYLGKQLQYGPFCEFVLHGLQALPTTAENPITVLRKIYGIENAVSANHSAGPPGVEKPDSQLRKWVQSWLAVRLMSVEAGQYETYCKTNLGVLMHHSNWSKEFEQLQASSHYLAEDENSARQCLIIKNGSSQILRPGLQPSVQQSSVPPEFPRATMMQQPFEVPQSVPSLGGFWPQPPNDMLPPFINRSNEGFNLSSLRTSLPQDWFPSPYERSGASSMNGGYPERIPSHEVSQMIREQALWNNMSAEEFLQKLVLDPQHQARVGHGLQ